MQTMQREADAALSAARVAERYEAAAHAVQTGVAFELERDPSSGTPKHLRVGVNLAMVYQAALANLMIAKGIITEAEYTEAIADETDKEADRYEEIVRSYLGPGVTLR